MTDVSATIAPKSDQLNADDLIAGPMTVKITKVADGTSKDQPIKIFFEGDDGKPYLPCKTMRRLLVIVWGTGKGADYVGREMTLFRDPKVLFGGVEVGGIRISHVSHIDKPQTVVLTASRTSRKPYVVQPLADKPAKAPKSERSLQDRVSDAETAVKACKTIADVAQARAKSASLRADLERGSETELLDKLDRAFEARQAELEEASKP